MERRAWAVLGGPEAAMLRAGHLAEYHSSRLTLACLMAFPQDGPGQAVDILQRPEPEVHHGEPCQQRE